MASRPGRSAADKKKETLHGNLAFLRVGPPCNSRPTDPVKNHSLIAHLVSPGASHMAFVTTTLQCILLPLAGLLALVLHLFTSLLDRACARPRACCAQSPHSRS